MTRVLIISPQAGFGNRVRALRSGIFLALKSGRIPYHSWHKTEDDPSLPRNIREMAPGYSAFFEGLPEANLDLFPTVDLCLTEWMPNTFWYSKQSYAQKLWNVKNIRQASDVLETLKGPEEVVLLETSLDHSECPEYQSTMIYKNYFNPKIHVTLEAGTTGFQFRTNPLFIHYFPEAYAPEDKLIEWFNKNKTSLNFVTSDSFEFTKKLGGINTDWFTDFLLLSKCCKIYGTYQSSFAEEAALFGGVPHLRISAI